MLITRRECDICGEDVGRRSPSWSSKRTYYAVIIRADRYGEMMSKPEKQKLDICHSCWMKMKKWITNERYKENENT